MSLDSSTPLIHSTKDDDLNKRLDKASANAEFHGDNLLADKQRPQTKWWLDLYKIFTFNNAPEILKVAVLGLQGKGLDRVAGAQLIASLPNDSKKRAEFIESQVKDKYDKMLHPPLTYLGDAFQYRAPDGKFNSVLHPHLGAAGAPYAKTVPSKSCPLGALPDPGDIFDKLMAREPKGRDSPSGLSSMLIYHATIIIHDIFRTNECDKNILDSSSYLDLSPLYGYNLGMQKKVRDRKFKLGLLKPDTFAEDRLLRQPPGVCIMLVMYNRYHNHAATQLKRINENGRFSIPAKFDKPTVWSAIAASPKGVLNEVPLAPDIKTAVEDWEDKWRKWEEQGQKPSDHRDAKAHKEAEDTIRKLIYSNGDRAAIDLFVKSYEAAWDKLDDDLFNTARLITCGIYINISIHDYLRALMGFHQYDTNFTLEPRVAMNHKNVSRGLGNQVTVEFNLLYRFHCAISQRDEEYTREFMREAFAELAEVDEEAKKTNILNGRSKQDSEFQNINVDNLSLRHFGALGKLLKHNETSQEPWEVEFGLKKKKDQCFKRNSITGLFDDQQMIDELKICMDDPISNFGPRNTPRCLKNVEIMGILQARKWEIGTLNDFRDFFGLGRHATFKDMSRNTDVANALRDLYDHPDKVELYPGIFCESDEDKGVDPGPSDVDSALWAAIFSDAITLVRSDRFYTVDWNTNSLTSWGMNQVSPDYDNLKTSVFHRLLQRAFPEWFPYDSIRFFHPFYTAQTNAQFALQQGYGATFRIDRPHFHSVKSALVYPASEPGKPPKPLYLNTYGDIEWVLSTGANEIIHPAFAEPANLPKKMQEALTSIQSKKPSKSEDSLESITVTKAYFTLRMQETLEREAIKMNASGENPTYQIDVTRDLAIPVVTRCIAEFLGFGDQIRDVTNPNANYSENEIYQHITNCQIFLSYNADETKLYKRRADFKKSMDFLMNLAAEGNVTEAKRSWMDGLFGKKLQQDERHPIQAMKTLGKSVAKRILEDVHDTGKAAAILLLTALDVAYIEVLAFTASLDHLLHKAYEAAKDSKGGKCHWFELQNLALPADESRLERDEKEDEKTFETIVLEAQKASVKLPFIRKVVKEGLKRELNGQEQVLQKGQIIICDIHEAMKNSNLPHLNYATSLSTDLIDFNPKNVAVHALTAMIKVMAQLKDLRRGHTSQGVVKKIEIDQTYEGYANFMADGRMKLIAHNAKQAVANFDEMVGQDQARRRDLDEAIEDDKVEELKNVDDRLLASLKRDATRVFSPKVLKPKQDTYLTASWDEMVPFPTTWKLRFEGYGASTYKSAKDPEVPRYPKLRPDPVPDNFPPFYQPSGTSHYGGTFAEVAGGPATSDTAKEAVEAGVCEQVEPGKVKLEKESEKELDKTEAGNAKSEKVKGCGIRHGEYPACWTDMKTKGCGAPAPALV
ncbi:hypothetical protein ACLMJK_009465 [Lecanora helva]